MGSRVESKESSNRETLAVQVAGRLMRPIVEQGPRPGDLLPSELQLRTCYHIGPSVARDPMRHLATLHMIQPPTMPPGAGPTTTCPRAGIGSLEREPDVDPPVVRMRRGHRKIADPAASPLEAKR